MAKPHPVDAYVGTRLKQRRSLLRMSQGAFSKAVGLSFQQIQKYERGSNRISSSRLYEFAKALDVPVSYFFEEMGSDVAARGRQHAFGIASEAPANAGSADPMTKRETLELVRAYYKITDTKVRKRLFEMTKALAAAAATVAERKSR